MRKRWAVLGLVVLMMLFFVGLAVADTGGSMGGGSWGGGGGGGYSGGGGGYSGGGGGYSGGGGGWSSGGGGGYYGSMPPGLAIVVIIVVVAIWLFGALAKSSSFSGGGGYSGLSSYTPVYDGADVSVLRIAVDGRARKFVQTELARIAKSANTATAEGRTEMLREVALMLRKLRDAWVYGGAVNHPMKSKQYAKGAFDTHVDDARSRFREELIRNAEGKTTTRDASEYTRRSDEGEGLILVTLVIAALRELFHVDRIGDGDDLRRALEALSQMQPGNLIAIEIIWQPAEESDRLSSMELEAKYPRPELIPLTNALVGKVFCDYCTGPFPGELVSCPHCGAPAPGRAKAA